MFFFEKDGSSKGGNKTILLVFDLYNKVIGGNNGNERVTKITYEIRTSPINTTVLNSPLCKISFDVTNGLNFSPYGLNYVNYEGTAKILQHN